MTMFIIQSFILLAIAFILGCLLGAILRYLFAPTKAPQPSAETKPTAVKAQSAPAPSKANKDNLQLISGVGPVLEKKLNEFGVYRFDQIANWSVDDIAAFNDKLSFQGRIERDEWLKQAKELAHK